MDTRNKASPRECTVREIVEIALECIRADKRITRVSVGTKDSLPQQHHFRELKNIIFMEDTLVLVGSDAKTGKVIKPVIHNPISCNFDLAEDKDISASN